MHQYYPAFVMRVYYDIHEEDVEGQILLCNLSCRYNHLDFCDVNKLTQPLENFKQQAPIGMEIYQLISLTITYSSFQNRTNLEIRSDV